MPLARLTRRHVRTEQVEITVIVEVTEHCTPTHAARIAHTALRRNVLEAPLTVVLEESIVQAGRQILDGDEHIEIAVIVVIAESGTRGVDRRIRNATLHGLIDEAQRRCLCVRGSRHQGRQPNHPYRGARRLHCVDHGNYPLVVNGGCDPSEIAAPLYQTSTCRDSAYRDSASRDDQLPPNRQPKRMP